MSNIKKKILTIIFLLTTTIIFGSIGYYLICGGQEEFIDCVYMTVVTLTTVGYGEIIDVSNNVWAKVYTMFLMLFGIGVLGYCISLTTAFLVEGELIQLLKERRMKKIMSDMRDHYIVCGSGPIALHVVQELIKTGVPTVVIADDAEDFVAEFSENRVFWLNGDPSDDELLLEANIENAKGIVVTSSSDKDNLYITVSVRQINPDIRVVVQTSCLKMKEKLQRVGANAIICTNAIGGLRMASEMIRPSVVSFLDKMLRHSKGTMRIEEVPVDSSSALIGKTIANSNFKEKFNLLILAIMHRDGEIYYNPASSTVIEEGDTLIVMGVREKVNQTRRLTKEELQRYSQ
ncbi:potassium channel family protein [Candidatus Uabimicrobium amorphum]|uniref:Potassium transporter TrkA n=1 Tax=Uabimicrobium amorphum TaxID=2596890 RepID=A0A5S9F1Y1_UABAM|nr:potassium channel protein [Candidatus Uabimicrobium amorphum]BBM83046.1 potassium transporter TrkA [Candidatus Uabimicrobium amorphum]